MSARRRLRCFAAALVVAAIAGCAQLPAWPGLPRGTGDVVPVALDGVTQTTPLIVGTVTDRNGRPAAGASVRLYEGLQLRLDGVTQTTPLEGVTQSTPLDGITQTTPFDGVTQTTPLQAEGETDDRGRFAIRAPGLRILAVEAAVSGGLVAARLGVVADKAASRIDVGTLALDRPGSAAGRVVGPAGDLAGIAVFVPGTDHLVRTDASGAYKIASIPAGTVRVAAIKPRFRPAVASGVTVRPDEIAAVPDLPLVPEAPHLLAIAPGNAAPGARIRLIGSDFGAAALAPLEVRFGTLRAPEVARLGDTAIEVVVPQGATSGPVAVVSDGVASNPLDFAVIATVSLSPAASRGAPGEPIALEAMALDTGGLLIASPSLTWRIEPADLGVLVPGTMFTAARAGFGRLVVRSGTLWATADLGFGSWIGEIVLGSGLPREGPLIGPASDVRLRYPTGLAIAPDGDLLFSDQDSQVLMDGTEPVPAIRRIGAGGRVTIAAGTGKPGYDGDGVATAASRVSCVRGAPAVGPGGATAFIDDLRVRGWLPADRTVLGRNLVAGRLWDLAGTGARGSDGAPVADPDGPDPAAIALGTPNAVAWDTAGSLYLVQTGIRSGRIREISPDGRVTTIVTAGPEIHPETQDLEADPGRFQATLHAVLPDGKGNLLLGTSSRIWLYCREAGTYFGVAALPGQLVAVAGTGRAAFDREEGPALETSLWSVSSLAFLGDSVVFADTSNNRVRILDPSGRIRTLAGGGPTALVLARDPAMRARAAATPGSGGTLAIWLNQPQSIAVGSDGTIYVADRLNHRILRLRDGG